MPTVMEMTEAVTDSSFWLQVLLLVLTSDLQPASELSLADMVEMKSGKSIIDTEIDNFLVPEILVWNIISKAKCVFLK